MALFINGVEVTPSPYLSGPVSVMAGGSISVFNTADMVTNYERLRIYTESNAFKIYAEQGGTGTLRSLDIYANDVDITSSSFIRLITGGTHTIYFDAGGSFLFRDKDNSNAVVATIASATGYARFGDTSAPTVSLEAADGFALAAGDLALANGLAITAPNSDDAAVLLKARDNGSSQVEIARLEGDAEPRFCHTKPINVLGAAASELTIATGVITITAGFHTVDTQADGATDDLDTINGGRIGDILVIVPQDAAHSVVAKHGTGNLNLSGGADFTMDEDDDFLVLLYIGTTWQEISRSENHA